jgi:hypothetical protein
MIDPEKIEKPTRIYVRAGDPPPTLPPEWHDVQVCRIGYTPTPENRLTQVWRALVRRILGR